MRRLHLPVLFAPLALLLAQAPGLPFWDTKLPRLWTTGELRSIFSESPWVQRLTADARGGGLGSPVSCYIASAEPMRLAEAEARRRAGDRTDPLIEEYLAWYAEQGANHVVLAVQLPDTLGIAEAREARRMEQDSVAYFDGKQQKLAMHFPPSSRDPRLRLAFPRPSTPVRRDMVFHVYLPGAKSGYRQAAFDARTLQFRGQTSY